MDYDKIDYGEINNALVAIEREAKLLAYKSCHELPDTAAIGRRRRLDNLNNKVFQVRVAYQELIDYEKRTEEMSKYMNELNEQFGDILKGS